jgi:hypothetical protein
VAFRSDLNYRQPQETVSGFDWLAIARRIWSYLVQKASSAGRLVVYFQDFLPGHTTSMGMTLGIVDMQRTAVEPLAWAPKDRIATGGKLPPQRKTPQADLRGSSVLALLSAAQT